LEDRKNRSIVDQWQVPLEAFGRLREKYLLYK
jgi:hypothetical protein